MSKQNIYDNEVFFEDFKSIRNNEINFNDLIETPILLAIDRTLFFSDVRNHNK